MIIQLLGMSQQLTYAADFPANNTFATSVASPLESFVGIQVNGSAFDVRDTSSYPGYSTRSTWLTGQGSTSDYEVRCSVVSGTLDSIVNGATQSASGVWLSAGSVRKWGMNRTTVGTRTTVVTLEVRSVYSATILDTATYTLQATVT